MNIVLSKINHYFFFTFLSILLSAVIVYQALSAGNKNEQDRFEQTQLDLAEKIKVQSVLNKRFEDIEIKIHYALERQSTRPITNKPQMDSIQKDLKLLSEKLNAAISDTSLDNNLDNNSLVSNNEQNDISDKQKNYEIDMNNMARWDGYLADKNSDLEWHATQTEQINSAFNDEDLSLLSLQNHECGSSLCKLEIAYGNQASEDQLSTLKEKFHWAYSGFMRTEGGIATVYMAKKNFNLN